jgi:hypothetical protein
MMEHLWTRAEDLLPETPPDTAPGTPPDASIDPAPLLGDWHNTDKESRGIVRLVLAAVDEAPAGINVHAWGAGSPAPFDWGEVPGGVYADSAGGTTAAAFGALYDHGFLRTHLQAKVNRGVLVVAVFNEFTDDSGRASYFTREFYYR